MKATAVRPSQCVPLLSEEELELILRGELLEMREPGK